MKILAENLKKVYRGRSVVNGVSLNINQGEVVGLLGPNGAGKTTTFYMIVGLVKPVEGKVFLDDEDITQQPMFVRARSGIGYLPQEPSIFRKLTVEDNIRLVLEASNIPKGQINQRIDDLLNEFHVLHIRNAPGFVLSGGERRRVEIARCLATTPNFILLDEPFTGIDPKTIEELQEIVRHLRDRGIGVLITDHNVEATLAITDRSYILVDGNIVVQGTREEVLQDELARKHYFGSSFGGAVAVWNESVANFLQSLTYPINKVQLLQQIKKKNPSESVLIFVEQLPSVGNFKSYEEIEAKYVGFAIKSPD